MTIDSASIVTFHTNPAELRHVLTLLEQADVHRTFVVDNSESPEIEQVCRSFKGVEYIPSKNNGYGAGHNKGLKRSIESGARYHLVMNSDVDFLPVDIKAMVDFIDSRPDVGCIQPRIVNTDGTDQYTARLLPAPIDPFIRRFMPGWFMRKRRHRYELRMLDHSRPFVAPFLQGSFMLFRINELKKHGLFDERFFLYLEDIDLSRRLCVHTKTMYAPVATVYHQHRAASYGSWKMTVTHSINMIRYFRKWGWFSDHERRILNEVTLKQADI